MRQRPHECHRRRTHQGSLGPHRLTVWASGGGSPARRMGRFSVIGVARAAACDLRSPDGLSRTRSRGRRGPRPARARARTAIAMRHAVVLASAKRRWRLSPGGAICGGVGENWSWRSVGRRSSPASMIPGGFSGSGSAASTCSLPTTAGRCSATTTSPISTRPRGRTPDDPRPGARHGDAAPVPRGPV